MSQHRTPRVAGYRQPAEWEPHAGVWVAWPSHDELWAQLLGDAQSEIVSLCEAIADVDEAGLPRGETIHMLVPNGVRHLEASEALEHLGVVFHRMPFGDIWMRDVAPIFVRSHDGAVAPVCFAFNGWGGKYVLDGDELVAGRIAELAGGELFAFGIVLEGGAIESDGEGTLLTTKQCMLNENRNPGLDIAGLERCLGDSLGARKLLFLEDGLLNDHTDGHIDTVARFVEPGRVVCMKPSGDDPNAEVLETIAKTLPKLRDAEGRTLEVERVPSPGLVKDHEGLVMPASYLNFYIANTTVVVPTYGTPFDDEAVEAIGALFPNRRVVGKRANGILTGGGTFHCVTQPQPIGAGH